MAVLQAYYFAAKWQVIFAATATANFVLYYNQKLVTRFFSITFIVIYKAKINGFLRRSRGDNIKHIHTKVRKSNDSSKFADRVVRGSLEEMLLFDNNGKCINAMKLVSNKMILKNAYIKIKSDLASFPSSRLPSFIRRVSKVTGVDKAIFDVISEE